MEVRIGTILVERGILEEDQVKAVLNIQRRTGEPFGLICERLYAITPEQVESAWAEQYALITRTIDPRLGSPSAEALETVTRRQAWQFGVLPIEIDGAELMMATTLEALPRALRFAANVIGRPVYFVMCEPLALQGALQVQYPLPGATLDGRRAVA